RSHGARGMRLAAVALAALALAAPAFAGGSQVSAADIETELVCPVCHETLDQSDSPAANQMKAEIRRRIAQGWTKKQIIDEMVANFGPGVLSTPAKHGFDLLAWVLPIGGALLGLAVVGAGALYWSRRSPPRDGPPPPRELDDAMELRIDEELARFDG
ncbi:MAG TPA: cytochrome c-type biogenesis protein CcmH, partial [Gaiellaceae bacterium]|nr:cytochrome c-type biogenesis protein CcmH [Gaiellaceae bacterium]